MTARLSPEDAYERCCDPDLFADPECPLCEGSGLYDDLTCTDPAKCCGFAICLCVWEAPGPRFPDSPEISG